MYVGLGRLIGNRKVKYLWDYNYNNYGATGIFFDSYIDGSYKKTLCKCRIQKVNKTNII